MKIIPINISKTSFSKKKYGNYSYITDPSGKFYAGMTIEEAKADGTDKSFWHRDFGNLDKDFDGVLSVEEIFKERKRAINNSKIDAAIFAVLGFFDAFIPTANAAEKLLFLLIDAAFIIYDLENIHNISKGNSRYYRMMEENSNINKFVANA